MAARFVDVSESEILFSRIFINVIILKQLVVEVTIRRYSRRRRRLFVK